MADGEVGGGLAELRELVSDELRRLDDLDRHRRVVEVLARHSQVDIARLGLTDRFVEDGEKRDHVVADARLELGDPRGVE